MWNKYCLNLKDVKNESESFFYKYDAVVYAGWALGGTVVKLKWFLEKANKWKDKILAVMCVGASPDDNPDVDTALKNILTDEQSKHIKVLYCQGWINYDKMKTSSKLALKIYA